MVPDPAYHVGTPCKLALNEMKTPDKYRRRCSVRCYEMLHDVYPESAVHRLHRLCRGFCPMQWTSKPNLSGVTF